MNSFMIEERHDSKKHQDFLETKKIHDLQKLSFCNLLRHTYSLYSFFCVTSISQPKHIKLTLIFLRGYLFCLTTSVMFLYRDDKDLLDDRLEISYENISLFDIFLIVISYLAANLLFCLFCVIFQTSVDGIHLAQTPEDL